MSIGGLEGNNRVMKNLLLSAQVILLGVFLFITLDSQGLLWNKNTDEGSIIAIQLLYPLIIFPIGFFLNKKLEYLEIINNKRYIIGQTTLFCYILGFYMAITLTSRGSYQTFGAYTFDFIMSIIMLLIISNLFIKSGSLVESYIKREISISALTKLNKRFTSYVLSIGVAVILNGVFLGSRNWVSICWIDVFTILFIVFNCLSVARDKIGKQE